MIFSMTVSVVELDGLEEEELVDESELRPDFDSGLASCALDTVELPCLEILPESFPSLEYVTDLSGDFVSLICFWVPSFCFSTESFSINFWLATLPFVLLCPFLSLVINYGFGFRPKCHMDIGHQV